MSSSKTFLNTVPLEKLFEYGLTVPMIARKLKGKSFKTLHSANDSTLMSDNTGVIDSSTVSSVVDPASMETTISFENITDVEDVIDPDNDVNNNNGYRLINMEMLANLFSPLTC